VAALPAKERNQRTHRVDATGATAPESLCPPFWWFSFAKPPPNTRGLGEAKYPRPSPVDGLSAADDAGDHFTRADAAVWATCEVLGCEHTRAVYAGRGSAVQFEASVVAHR
jgi:hypothetical protein